MEKFIKILANIKNVPTSKIKLDHQLIEDLMLSSLDFAALIMEFESQFRIAIDIKTFVSLRTVKELRDYIKSLIC